MLELIFYFWIQLLLFLEILFAHQFQLQKLFLVEYFRILLFLASIFSNQLINLYTSSLGDWSYYLIAIAAFSTMLSTTITAFDASPRAMAVTTELIFDKKIKHIYIIWLLILCFGTITIFFIFSSQMGMLIKIATILSFLTAPFYAITNYILITSNKTPKEFRPSKLMHLLSVLGIIYLVGFSVFFLIKGF